MRPGVPARILRKTRVQARWGAGDLDQSRARWAEEHHRLCLVSRTESTATPPRARAQVESPGQFSSALRGCWRGSGRRGRCRQQRAAVFRRPRRRAGGRRRGAPRVEAGDPNRFRVDVHRITRRPDFRPRRGEEPEPIHVQHPRRAFVQALQGVQGEQTPMVVGCSPEPRRWRHRTGWRRGRSVGRRHVAA